MEIKQFEDNNLSHYSYAILSECEHQIVLIDPSRNPGPYLEFAKEKKAEITGIIETHLHADFVSGHLELHLITGAPVYVSKQAEALYPHMPYDDGQSIQLGKIKLSALNTPGHSPDSICILLEHEQLPKAVFTGDTLFVGDCGRPDLREGEGDMLETKTELAHQLFHSLRNKLLPLPGEVVVYPAHGQGTLCGKDIQDESSSTIDREKKTNWSLQHITEDAFVKELLSDQPFVPAYFPFNVGINRLGASPLQASLSFVKILATVDEKVSPSLNPDCWVIDTRNATGFRAGHLPHSINLMEDGKFETWLGSIIKPNERFYLACEDSGQISRMLERTAVIGYESQVEAAFEIEKAPKKSPVISAAELKANEENYTILDVRNPQEVQNEAIFPSSIPIPLPELRSRLDEIPLNKPIVVHCAGGYRSAAASSLLQSRFNGKVKVLDLGSAVKEFQ